MARTMEIQVLRALDQAKTQLYHFMAIVIAGMGFFTDAYDLFSISLITRLLGRIYYHKDSQTYPGTLPRNVEETVAGVALCGTFAGQLFFGFLGDRMGRKRAYGVTLILMVVCSIGSGLSFGDSAASVISMLCFFRFWLGFGVGGDYPLSAAIMAEYANTKTRGAFIAAVFAMQGLGILAAAVVAMIVSAAFKNSNDPAAATVPQADYVWRIVLMLGALPAALTYYWRMKMPETARYTALVERNAGLAAADMSTVLHTDVEVAQDELDRIALARSNNFGLFSKEFARRHGRHLIGTTTTWFLLDIPFYGLNLFLKDIFTEIGWLPKEKSVNAIDEVYNIARAQCFIALCGTIPGYWFTVALVDIIGRVPIQLAGFFFMTVFTLGLAIPYDKWEDNRIGFVVMYGLTFFFANFGPNTITFIISAEIFPARLRTTCHGISAAAGKAGAIVATFGVFYATQSRNPNNSSKEHDNDHPKRIGVKNLLFVLAACNLCGLVLTLLLPESKGKYLEELTGENMDDDHNNDGAVERDA